MRRNVQDSLVRFRANGVLVEEAERKARRSGMSLSEFMRHAIRRELEAA